MRHDEGRRASQGLWAGLGVQPGPAPFARGSPAARGHPSPGLRLMFAPPIFHSIHPVMQESSTKGIRILPFVEADQASMSKPMMVGAKDDHVGAPVLLAGAQAVSIEGCSGRAAADQTAAGEAAHTEL